MITLDFAIEYAELGFKVIPVSGKTPFFNNWPEKATSDINKIKNWSKSWDGNNIGIVMENGIFCFDVDPRNGGDIALKTLQQINYFPETATAITGGGGFHYLYKSPNYNVKSINNIFTGIDIVGDGKIIIVEPSIHPKTKKEYVWSKKLTEGISDVPDWLLKIIMAKQGDDHASIFSKINKNLNRVGDEKTLLEGIINKYPINNFGQRYNQMVKIIGSLMGRGFNIDLVENVAEAWTDYFISLGKISTGREKCLKDIKDCIKYTLNSNTFGYVERSKYNYKEKQDKVAEIVYNINLLPLLSHTDTHRQQVANLLYRSVTDQEISFIQALTILTTLQTTNGWTVKFTNRQIQELMTSRLGKSINNKQLERLKTKFVSRKIKPANKFELLIQVYAGNSFKKMPSEYSVTGLQPVIDHINELLK